MRPRAARPNRGVRPGIPPRRRIREKRRTRRRDQVRPMSVGLATPTSKPADVAPTPPSAEFAPSSFRVAEKESLEKALLSHAWSWKNTGNNAAPKSVQFHEDGRATCSSGEHWRWEVAGERTVTCIWDDHPLAIGYMFLVFDQDMNSFEGHDNDWAVVAKGTIRHRRRAGSGRRTAVPLQWQVHRPRLRPRHLRRLEKEALERVLLSNTWTWTAAGSGIFAWKEVMFWTEGTMTASTPIRARWTVAGPRSATIQFNEVVIASSSPFSPASANFHRLPRGRQNDRDRRG